MPGYLNLGNRAERRKAIAEFRKEAPANKIKGYNEYVAAMEQLKANYEEAQKAKNQGPQLGG